MTSRVQSAGADDPFVKAFWKLRVNSSEVVLHMAFQTLILNVDRCTKNVVYAIGPDLRWQVVPIDLEDAFATDDREGKRDCEAEGASCRDDYCYLSCPKNFGLFLCDRAHPQDAFEKTTYTHLVDAVLYTPPMRKLYLDVVRSVLANYSESGWLAAQVADIRAEIGPDAALDAAKWNASRFGFDGGVDRLLAQIEKRRRLLQAELKSLGPH